MADAAQWLDLIQEEIIEPERPIIDPHHHLWDRRGNRYLIDELVADAGSGHNIVSTVFIECFSMYRAAGPEPLQPVGDSHRITLPLEDPTVDRSDEIHIGLQPEEIVKILRRSRCGCRGPKAIQNKSPWVVLD